MPADRVLGGALDGVFIPHFARLDAGVGDRKRFRGADRLLDKITDRNQ
jgi:hypothetical protein